MEPTGLPTNDGVHVWDVYLRAILNNTPCFLHLYANKQSSSWNKGVSVLRTKLPKTLNIEAPVFGTMVTFIRIIPPAWVSHVGTCLLSLVDLWYHSDIRILGGIRNGPQLSTACWYIQWSHLGMEIRTCPLWTAWVRWMCSPTAKLVVPHSQRSFLYFKCKHIYSESMWM